MRLPLLLVLLIGQYAISAQAVNDLFAWEGSAQVNFRISQSWSGNTGLGKRSIWSDGESIPLSGKLAFYEFDQFLTRRISPYLKASGGYKYRWLDPGVKPIEVEQRLTQQIAWVHSDNKTRWVSRLRTEQRFRRPSFAHRYRYRISVDRALSGERLDNREFYLSLSNEVLFEVIEDDSNTIDNRITVGLGYFFSNHFKAELSATLRIENLTQEIEEITFFNTRVFFDIR